MANVIEFPDEVPTKPVNDAPTLLRIMRLAALARERLTICPDEAAIDIARTELQAIESIASEALK